MASRRGWILKKTCCPVRIGNVKFGAVRAADVVISACRGSITKALCAEERWLG
jgi:hypothetical protein